MHMNITKLKIHPIVFQRLLGLNPEQFNRLVHELEPAWQRLEYRRKTSYKRKIKVGSGRPYNLTFETMVAMHLMYLRTYIPHLFLGELFHIDNSGVCRYFAKLRPILAKQALPLRIRRITISEQEIMRLIVDATEQPTERKRGTKYSGKKKTHTIKTQIVVNPRGTILHVSQSVPGNRHDKKLFDQTKPSLPHATKLLGDLGYLGARGVSVPYKSSKLKPLTKRQVTYNQSHAHRRIIVEHVFAHLKKWRILAYRFRNPIPTYNHIFTTICALRNFATA